MTTTITPPPDTVSCSVPSTTADSAVQSPTGFYQYVQQPPVVYTVSDGQIVAQTVDVPQLARLR
jgi:hypothetical protein